ncbi:FAD/NAD(P)-binding domain-containing protein [Hesseltinella vesiculosa]|uniref:FAD/NAD(P)-binding domain-containing protein n=1 Tax=Hesseltinella vesiculosa TaxID=101127 RepID=A0A1X2G7W2_9FUNG|nr:FAD/NAD(P)-binding domain-containing protein [Hesseltinella vesiculosa]
MTSTDVLIVGAGPSGLFTALLLVQMKISVRIIDKRKREALPHPLDHHGAPRMRDDDKFEKRPDQFYNNIVLLSPRSLQLLAFLGLFDLIKARGRRHSKVQLYTSTTVTSTSMDFSAMANLVDSFGVWDNKATDYNFAISIEKKQLCDILEAALQKLDVQVDYGSALVRKSSHHVGSDMINCDVQTFQHGRTLTQTWRCLYLISTARNSSLVQPPPNAAPMSLNRKKPKPKAHMYSLMARANTNYPEAEALSVISKPEGSLYVLVHESYFSFVLQPSNGSDSAPMDLLASQKLIQRILQPYYIDFLDTYDFSYSQGAASNADQQQIMLDSRYFLLGSASQQTFPPGWLVTDLGLEQAMNLGWKLHLHLQKRSTPHLLNTYQSETRLRRKETVAAMQLLPRVHRLMKACHHEDASALIQEHRSCFTGGILLEDNILNWNCPRSIEVRRGAVGTLAPNARLKPYQLQQLAIKVSNAQTRQHLAKKKHSLSVNSLSSNEDDPPTSPGKLKFFRQLLPFKKSLQQKKSSPALNPSTTLSFNLPPPTTLSIPPNPSDKWRHIKANHYFLWDELASHGPRHPDRSFSTFTILVLCGSLADPTSIKALQRFRRHLDQANSFLRQFEYAKRLPLQPRRSVSTPQPSHPTSSSSPSTSSSTSSLASTPVHPLADPYKSLAGGLPSPNPTLRSSSGFSSSSMHNYDFLQSPPPTPGPRSSSDHLRGSNATHYSARSSSISSITNASSPYQRSSSTSSYSSSPYQRSSSTSSAVGLPPPSSPPPTHAPPPIPVQNPSRHPAKPASPHDSPLFFFTYLTTSPKPVCSSFLAEQAPATLDQLFPFGLDRVFLDHDQQSHQLYCDEDLQAPLAVVIRPDGYIGAKFSLLDDKQLFQMNRYFDGFLLPNVDMHSAAAMVANDFIF